MRENGSEAPMNKYMKRRLLFFAHMGVALLHPRKGNGSIGADRILKVEGHSGGSNYFGAKRRKKIFGAPTFPLCPPSF